MKKTSRVVFGGLFIGALLAPGSGCVSVPDEAKQPVLGTHVEDWRDEVIYQVLVDRYADGDANNDYKVQPGALARYQGGDWRGLMQNLDYVQSLGVTTLWISPVVKNVETDANVDAYHGYWAQDLTQTNPHFGDLADLRELTAAAHTRNMKVVLDIVTNHMGQAFFYDMNLNGVPDTNVYGTGTSSPVQHISEYDPDWDPRGVQAFSAAGNAGRAPIVFIQDPGINRVPPQPGILSTAAGYHGFGRILNYDDPAQRTLGDFPGGLKDVATEIPEVRATMVDAYTRWVELADLDGFRIDTVKHVEHEFWQVFTAAVRARLAKQGKNRFLMFGESFDGNDQLLGSYTVPGELDSVFYFSQHYQVYRDIFVNAHDPKSQKGTSQIQELWAQKKTHYGVTPQAQGAGVAPYKLLVNFLDNHDVARFLSDAAGDKDALRNALTLLITEDGIPCIYYGTEQDFSGGNDPANREILWTSNFDKSGDTFRHIAKITSLRKKYEALRRADTKVTWASAHTGAESDAGMFAFERAGGDVTAGGYALVVLNTNAKNHGTTQDGTKTMTVSQPAGTVLVDVLDPNPVQLTVGTGGTLVVAVDPQKARILIPQAQVKP